MADRFKNPYQYRKPHSGQSVLFDGMIPTPNHPDTAPPNPYGFPADPNTDGFSNPWREDGGSKVGRKPKPSPLSPSGGMALDLPRMGAVR